MKCWSVSPHILQIISNLIYINKFIREQLFKNIEYAELQYPKNLSEGAISLLKGVNYTYT
jgi:hypothetical protein